MSQRTGRSLSFETQRWIRAVIHLLTLLPVNPQQPADFEFPVITHKEYIVIRKGFCSLSTAAGHAASFETRFPYTQRTAGCVDANNLIGSSFVLKHNIISICEALIKRLARCVLRQPLAGCLDTQRDSVYNVGVVVKFCQVHSFCSWVDRMTQKNSGG